MRKLLSLLVLFCLIACQSESRNSSNNQNPLKYTELVTATGETIETTLAISQKDQEQGLSGVKPEDFADNQGMLFFYTDDGDRMFWMPDTYFDLDLFFLDKDLKVVDVIRKLPFYVGRASPELIPRARNVWSRHVLEIKSSSPIASKIDVGQTLTWKGGLSLQETEAKVKSGGR